MAAVDGFRGAPYATVYSLRPGDSQEAAAITRRAAAAAELEKPHVYMPKLISLLVELGLIDSQGRVRQ